MSIFISLLRGINLGSRNRISMPDLAALYQKLGFDNVKTYIQSGNVVFETDQKMNSKDLEVLLKQAILDNFNLQVPVIIRSLDEIEKICSQNPFLDKEDMSKDKLHVTFLADLPELVHTEVVKNLDYKPDKCIILNKEVYLYCPINYGETKFSNTFLEKKLKVTATTRNWRTVSELYKLGLELGKEN